MIPLLIPSSHTIPFIPLYLPEVAHNTCNRRAENWARNGLWCHIGWAQVYVSHLLAALHWATRKHYRFLILGISTTTLLLLPSVRWIQSILPHHFPLTTTITWAAILLYDYCLTFAAEVERCWSAHRLNWSLGFFYLNRYLTLFGHVPIMIEFFWSTSNPNKTEVSISLPKGPMIVWGGKHTDAQPLRC